MSNDDTLLFFPTSLIYFWAHTVRRMENSVKVIIISITVCENQVKTPQEGQMLNCTADCNLKLAIGLATSPLMNQTFIRVHIIGD